MSVDGVTNVTQTYGSQGTTKTKESQSKKTEETKEKSTESSEAAVYEKSEQTTDSNKKIYKRDNATVEKLLQESEKRTQALRDLVQKMLLKQGETYTESTDIYSLLREGKLKVDPEVSAQAQKDVAEDGYWGVEQTSDRLVSFAKALSGGDTTKADEMIAAVKKGFEQATKAWGNELPGITKDTMDAAISKLEAWRDGTDSSSSMSSTASNTFKNQTAASKLAE